MIRHLIRLVMLPLLFLGAKAFANPSDFQAVFKLHTAWKSAFEQADLLRVSRIWAHDDDVKLINLFDDTRHGWDEVHAELFLLFQRVGQTEITTSNLIISVAENQASATSDYR